ncbi:MAG: hypothetical protein IKK73_04835, partial [Akkermansia sp.]|nr:hypothetical protein [Akkermansia sp.]
MDLSLFRAGHKVQREASRWMLYFMAMLGSASGQETLLDYWFLWGDEKAASPGGDTSRVIRVEGAKGEHYVPVYEDMHCHPLVAQARAGFNARRRQEALKLSRQYQDAGMSHKAAYEKAWAEVYQRFRSQSSKEEAKEALLQLVARTQTAGADVSATDAAVQHVLQLLVLHEELLATAEARELLDYLFRQQLIFEKEALLAEPGTNDALMVLFADAMVHGMKGANAFRDAQFKLNRERIFHHELTGYLAPWGAGLGSRINYRQASRKKAIATATLGYGTLKTALPDEEEKKQQQEQEDKKKVTTASGETGNNAPKPVYMGPPSGGWNGPARFALMRAAAPEAGSPEAGEISDYTYTWNGAGTNNIWSAAGSAENSGWGTQSATSGQPGVYENGYAVTFNDTASSRDVILVGTVAPGNEIAVNADSANGAYAGSSAATTLEYGYAVTGAGSIADYTDRDGNLLARTSITNAGSALLVLDTENSFSGGIRLESGASVYLGRDHAAGTGTITMGDNSSLIVNYRSADISWRSPSLSNALVVNGDVRISTGWATFGEDRLPCDWRTLTLSGGVSGSGELALYGYSYMVKPTLYEDRSITYNYVSAFAINEKNAVSGGSAPNRFTGTVFLRNEFNHRADGAQEVNVDKAKFVGGAVQLTLVDDVFSEATLNMVRDKTEEGERDAVGSNSGPFGNIGPAMTSDNILVLSDNTQICIGALEADFIGGAFTMSYKDGGNYTPYTGYVSEGGSKGEYGQEHERWNVRVVTDGYTNLVLDDDDTVEAHAFAGSMGFAHSYTTSAQAYIHAPLLTGKNINNATYATEPTNPGGGSLGLEALSLEKRGKATQYIHSANLQNLSVLGGVVGFNHLSLAGNLVIRSGTDLAMSAATNEATGWADLSETSWASTDVLTIAPGKQMLVVSDSSQSAAITGSLTMSAGNTDVSGSMLSFDIETLSPSADEDLPHLTVSGTLTLQKDTPVSVSIGDAGFLAAAGTSEYYLAKASTLSVMDGDKKGTFQIQLIPLGYGYYGSVYVDGQYLMMK